MLDILTNYLLAIYVVMGLVTAALLGAGIGSTGLSWEVARATRRVRAERDEAREQLALTEDSLAAATHLVQHADDLPEDIEALARVVSEEDPRKDSKAWLRNTTPAPMSNEPCLAITADPYFPGYREMVCQHDAAHHGEHQSGDIEWDDDDTWVRGERL